MTHRIVQLTDCHLFTDHERAIRGIVTWPRFVAALNDVRHEVPDFDLLVITGDLAHDEVRTTYELARSKLLDWAGRLRIIPGNHDDRTALREVFPDANGGGPTGRLTFQQAWNDWQVIGLDSQRPGELAGALGEEQLAWLRNQLAAAMQLPTLLFLHHPPVAIRSAWLDKIALQDAPELAQLLRDHPQVKLIGCGHVHQEFTASLSGATVFTTPAVGAPFRPRTEELEIDEVPPGYRIWELCPGGRWSTQVLRFRAN